MDIRLSGNFNEYPAACSGVRRRNLSKETSTPPKESLSIIGFYCFRVDSRNINKTELINIAQKYQCTICGYIYDPEKGDPDSGVAPGTPFENLPEDWVCPQCGATKDAFEVMK